MSSHAALGVVKAGVATLKGRDKAEEDVLLRG